MRPQNISESFAAERRPISATIVHPHYEGAEAAGVIADNNDVVFITQPWSLRIVPAAKVREYTYEPTPVCTDAFVRAVARIEGVRCVVVEKGEHKAVHITTFVENVSEQVREQIYSIELETIRANQDMIFDFHVRRSEEAAGSLSGSGTHYYAIWGSLGNADRS